GEGGGRVGGGGKGGVGGGGGGGRAAASDGSETAHAPQQPAGDARRPARAPRDLVAAVRRDLDAEHARAAAHDLFELGLGIEIEPDRDAESVAQRRREETGARRGADQ